MSEEHTLLPWKSDSDGGERFEVADCDGQAIIAQVDPCEDLPPEQRKAITNLIVKACNAYDQDQETIKALVDVCETVLPLLYQLRRESCNPEVQKICWQLQDAMALAKEKRNS